MTVRNDLLVTKQKNSNPFAPTANLSVEKKAQPKFSGLSLWTQNATNTTSTAAYKGQSIWDISKKNQTTAHKTQHTLSQKDTEKKAKSDAGAEKQKGAVAQTQGKSTTTSANAQKSDINNRGSQTDSTTQAAQSSNTRAMQGIKNDTTSITALNGRIRLNQQQTKSLQHQRANTQARLDMLLGVTSSNGASAAQDQTDAAGSGNKAGAKSKQAQNTSGSANANAQASADTNNTTDTQADKKYEVFSLETAADKSEKQQKGQATNEQRLAQANGNKPQAEAHKQDKKMEKSGHHSPEKPDHGSNRNKSEMDKLDPEKRAEAERLMAELASKDQQIQTKTQQRYSFLSNKSHTYSNAQSQNQRQNQVLSRANSNADGTKQTAIQVLGVAQMLHTAATAVKMVGVGVTAAGHALSAIPYVGPVIGPPVVTCGQTTQHVGEIACEATSVLSKAAGAVKAAVIGDIRAIGMAAVQLLGVTDNLNAANAGDAVQGAAGKLTETVGDNMVSRALDTVGEVVKDTGKLVSDTVKTVTDTATDVVKTVAHGAADIVKDVTGFDVSSVAGDVKDVVKTAQDINKGVQGGQQLANLSTKGQGGGTPSFGITLSSDKNVDDLVKMVLADPTAIYKVPSDKKEEVTKKVEQEKPGTLDKKGNAISNDFAYAA